MNGTTPDGVLATLSALGEVPATLTGLAALFRADRQCIFDLGVIGVTPDAPDWAVELALLAKRVRAIVRQGYEIVDDGTDLFVVSGNYREGINRADLDEVKSFLQQLNGVSTSDNSTKDYVGEEVSVSEIRFKVGDPMVSAEAVSARMDARPTMVSLDTEDRDAVEGGMPGYVVHGLLNSAVRVLQAPTVIFEGIRSDGDLENGRAYCGKPKRTYDNLGNAQPPPDGFVFVVFTDAQGHLFDWDWVAEDQDRPGFPIEWEGRFRREVQQEGDIFVAGLEGIQPGLFRRDRTWYSAHGDCLFFYASDTPAYARRLNNDLTAFISFEDETVVGCKVKNFKALVLRWLSRQHVNLTNILTESIVTSMAGTTGELTRALYEKVVEDNPGLPGEQVFKPRGLTAAGD